MATDGSGSGMLAFGGGILLSSAWTLPRSLSFFFLRTADEVGTEWLSPWLKAAQGRKCQVVRRGAELYSALLGCTISFYNFLDLDEDQDNINKALARSLAFRRHLVNNRLCCLLSENMGNDFSSGFH